MRISVDFDGTIVAHEGDHVPHALDSLKTLINDGHKVFLWTLRSGESLDNALRYLDKAGVIISGANVQSTWTDSPKTCASCYIDDAAIGCPLIEMPEGKPCVDWLSVMNLLGY